MDKINKSCRYCQWIVLALVVIVVAVLVVNQTKPGWLKGLFGLASGNTIIVNAGGNLQQAINDAQCGDTIVLQAGATWDVPGVFSPFVLPNKGCTASNSITIQSSAVDLLPNDRVSPANASSMARIRARGGDGAFQFALGTSNWILDGLEVTNVGNDTEQEIVNSLIVAGATVSNITIQRSYLHPKETGTDYTRSVLRAMVFDGSGLNFKWNHASGFLGRMAAGDTGINTNSVILCITCNNLNVIDNYLQAWYTAIFTGGGTEQPQYSATMSGTPTMSSATFSNTTGLGSFGSTGGRYLRFGLKGSIEITGGGITCTNGNGNTFTNCWQGIQRSGVPLNSGDSYHQMWVSLPEGAVFRGRISTVNGSQITLSPDSSQSMITGTFNYELFEVAEVTSVSGNIVNYTPVGVNRLNHAPAVTDNVVWREQQVVHDVNVIGNTFNIDTAHALAEGAASNNSPKGWVEFKAGENILFEGNEFIGYPSLLGFPQHSNEGHTPWTKVKNLTIRSNWSHPDQQVGCNADGACAARSFVQIDMIDPYNSDEPGSNLTIENNLVSGVSVLLVANGVTTATVKDNTVFNNQFTNNSYHNSIRGLGTPDKNWVIKDNIIHQHLYGFSHDLGIPTGFPGVMLQKNLVIDDRNTNVVPSQYGTGGYVSPIPLTTSAVGFAGAVPPTTNPQTAALSTSSPYRNSDSTGTDPGVDMAKLVTALGSTFTPPPPSGDTTPPTTSVTSPTSGSTVAGTQTISASASDNTGVTRVEFYVDGNLKGQDTSSLYSYPWDTTNGGTHACTGAHTHILTTKAYDAANNVGTSGNTSVNMNNPDYCTTPPPSSSCPTTIPTGSFLGCYYDNRDFTGAVVVKNSDPYPINYDWVNGSPDSSLGVDYFSARWTGNFTFESADYTFTSRTDDGVRVYVDNQLIIDQWTYQPATTYTVTKAMTAGSHQIKMEFFEGDGGALASMSWTKNTVVSPPTPDPTAPAVSLTAPTSGTTVSGTTTTVTATATDNIGVTGVQFKLDGTNLGTEDTSSPYSISWNTTTTSNASHTLTATARDAAGNSTTSSAVTVTVNNITTPPTNKFIIGDRVHVTVTKLNVRPQPAKGKSGFHYLNDLGTVIGGPITASGLIWWNINFDTTPDGWAAQDYLAK